MSARVMMVTGASRGIGARIAVGAAARGYAVVVNYALDTAAAEAVVREISEAGGQAIAVQADVAMETGVLRLFQAADAAFGKVNVLVNNAAITGGFAKVSEVSAETLSRVFAVNVLGAFLCAREAVGRMSTLRGGAGGSIINISSRAAAIGGSGEWVHYAATKGALDTLTVGLANEVAREGIRVNGVAAGLVATGLHAAAGDPDRPIRMAPHIPMGRAGSTGEIAEAVLWLASPQASYITGAILPVAGGR